MQRPWQWDWARERAASRPRVAPLYGLWTCAYKTGDWSAVSNHWPALEASTIGTRTRPTSTERSAPPIWPWPGAPTFSTTTTVAPTLERARNAFAEGLEFEQSFARMRQAYARRFDGFNDRDSPPATGSSSTSAPRQAVTCTTTSAPPSCGDTRRCSRRFRTGGSTDPGTPPAQV